MQFNFFRVIGVQVIVFSQSKSLHTCGIDSMLMRKIYDSRSLALDSVH